MRSININGIASGFWTRILFVSDTLNPYAFLFLAIATLFILFSILIFYYSCYLICGIMMGLLAVSAI